MWRDAKKIHYLVVAGKTLGTCEPHTWGRKMGNSSQAFVGVHTNFLIIETHELFLLESGVCGPSFCLNALGFLFLKC